MANGNKSNSVRCSFCGKTQNAVEKLIAGPGVYICDECIKACNGILEDELYENEEEYTLNENEKIAWNNLKSNEFFSYKYVNSEYNLSCKIGDYWIGGRLDAIVKKHKKLEQVLHFIASCAMLASERNSADLWKRKRALSVPVLADRR